MAARIGDWQMVFFWGAQHSFTIPAADGKTLQGALYSALADWRSWEHMKLFFSEVQH